MNKLGSTTEIDVDDLTDKEYNSRHRAVQRKWTGAK